MGDEQESEKDEDEIESIKTPSQRRKKMKRKRYTPKVIREAKPVRTPKTPKVVREAKPVRTPKTPAATTENPAGKRKYTRKTRAPAADPPAKRGLIFESEGDDDGKPVDSNEAAVEEKPRWGLYKMKRRSQRRKIEKRRGVAWGSELHTVFGSSAVGLERGTNSLPTPTQSLELDQKEKEVHESSIPSCPSDMKIEKGRGFAWGSALHAVFGSSAIGLERGRNSLPTPTQSLELDQKEKAAHESPIPSCPSDMNCCRQPPTPQKEIGCRNRQSFWVYGPRARIEVLIARQLKLNRGESPNKELAILKPKPRGRPKKNHAIVDPSPSNAKRIMDVYSIVAMLRRLSINDSHGGVKAQARKTKPQNALVPYAGGDGVLVSSKGLRAKKKEKIAGRVRLDDESIREWERLMGNESIGDDDGKTEADREKFWEEERRNMCELVHSFIGRMHQILGNRKFSRWKGSVIDSVVGVFLTQNVSDVLSSNAFLDLAARFPIHSKAGNNIDNVKQSQVQNFELSQKYPNSENGERRNNMSFVEKESDLRNEASTSEGASYGNLHNSSKGKDVKSKMGMQNYDWESMQKQTLHNGVKKERCKDNMDSLDYDAVWRADVNEIANAIKSRGQHNILAEKIKTYLDRLVRDHGSIDLEWLRDILPDKAKDYLISVYGLGIKSAECVRLLCLEHQAFPVDVNVARIVVRLGWAPLQPLPDSVPLHLLETYPDLGSIQKYLWPRLCKLDHETLYMLHYLLITFGKVFCTKAKPNCNACPMRGECKHFASAYLSTKCALPGPQETGLVSSAARVTFDEGHGPVPCQLSVVELEGSTLSHDKTVHNNCEPIIEEPATPEHKCLQTFESDVEDIGDIEDAFNEIPTIKIDMEVFKQNLQSHVQEMNAIVQYGDMSKALVSIASEAASIPMPKLKHMGRLRTLHHVYVLRDEDRIFLGLEELEPDDPGHYLLAIWTPGETAQSFEPSQPYCKSPDGSLCDDNTCRRCSGLREAQAGTVRGTILIPVRTATRGSFPLNGTYFQVNEVFADHHTSHTPLDFPTARLFQMKRAFVCFGKTVSSMLKGVTIENIQYIFWRGYVCVRAYDRETRRSRLLAPRLHVSPTEATKIKGKNRQRGKSSNDKPEKAGNST